MATSAREFFESARLRAPAGLAATYRFDLAGAGSWWIRVADGAVSMSESDAAADCVIETSEETFLRIVRGEQSPLGAYLTGKVRVRGDVGLAARLADLLA